MQKISFYILADELPASLKRMRKHCRYTQRQVAALVNLSSVTISHYETGRRSISLEMIVRLARIYGFELSLSFKQK